MGLDITGIGSVASLVSNIADKIWPDPAKRAEAQAALLAAQQAGALKQLDDEFQLSIEQIKTNAAEAASTDPLQHWRGGLGWVCVLAYLNNFVIVPYANAFGAHVPTLDGNELFTLTGGMLGLGSLHAYQQVKSK